MLCGDLNGREVQKRGDTCVSCFPGGSLVKKLLAMQEMQETRVRSLGQEDPLEEGMAALQNSCLENPTDRGARRATAQGVAQSQT